MASDSVLLILPLLVVVALVYLFLFFISVIFLLSSYSHFFTCSTIIYGTFALYLCEVMWGPCPHKSYPVIDLRNIFLWWPKLGTLMWRYHHGCEGIQPVWSHKVPYSEISHPWFMPCCHCFEIFKNFILNLVFCKWTPRIRFSTMSCSPIHIFPSRCPMDTEFQWTYDAWSSVRPKTSISVLHLWLNKQGSRGCWQPGERTLPVPTETCF